MTTDMSAFATKKDLTVLKKAFQKGLSGTNKRLDMTKVELKHDISRTEKRLDTFHNEFLDFKDDSIKRFSRIDERLYFEAAVENFRKDMRDFKNDDLETVKHRVTRLEIHTGIRAA
ncbi:MAG: hypothetical protein HOO67_02380 [Candidatus Peribacteraceae bacterium]|nr:hypothetical protein [Candidatus Peribacteraceae bacterium]